jgi:hypothetical protein
VWSRQVAGRILTFRLAGINNQNFLMRDEETGTYWQQISGRAIAGPLAGQQLELIPSDELSFALWRQENPAGLVLKPVAKFAGEYEPADWETRMAKARTVVDTAATGTPARTLVLGLEMGGVARAFAVEKILKAKLLPGRVGAVPVIFVVGPDEVSIRTFSARIPGEEEVPDFYRDTENRDIFLDAATGSRWNFRGCAIDGPAEGKCLTAIYPVKDYWFDWRQYHPGTSIDK